MVFLRFVYVYNPLSDIPAIALLRRFVAADVNDDKARVTFIVCVYGH